MIAGRPDGLQSGAAHKAATGGRARESANQCGFFIPGATTGCGFMTRHDTVRDNFHWRDLRGLGKLLAYGVYESDSHTQGARDGNVAASVAATVRRVDEARVRGVRQAKVMEAVNDAPDGQWIAGSEEQVRDLSAEMRRRIFERALQKRVDAAEAAFPPSARSDDGQAAGE